MQSGTLPIASSLFSIINKASSMRSMLIQFDFLIEEALWKVENNEVALWKMENNEEAMCKVPLCIVVFIDFSCEIV